MTIKDIWSVHALDMHDVLETLLENSNDDPITHDLYLSWMDDIDAIVIDLSIEGAY